MGDVWVLSEVIRLMAPLKDIEKILLLLKLKEAFLSKIFWMGTPYSLEKEDPWEGGRVRFPQKKWSKEALKEEGFFVKPEGRLVDF